VFGPWTLDFLAKKLTRLNLVGDTSVQCLLSYEMDIVLAGYAICGYITWPQAKTPAIMDHNDIGICQQLR
jgi:hypothetical protein